MAREPIPVKPVADTPDNFTFQAFAGLRNTVTSERLGPEDLQIAKNVDIDDAKQVHRRRGFTQVSSGDFHSLFTATSGKIYGVKNNDLSLIYPNYTSQVIKAGVGPERLAYTQVGDEVYFTSTIASGVIRADDSVSDWGASTSENEWLSPVVNPTSTLRPVSGKFYGKPPLASQITYYNGRIYLADENIIWATELYLYNYVDKTKNYIQYETDVTMLAAVSDGIFVGTTQGVWFMSGSFNEMRRIQVHSSGAIPGSVVDVEPQDVRAAGTSSRKGVLFLTESGLCAGFDSGVCINITDQRMWFPEATSAAALYREQDGVKQYIGVTDTGGSPTSSARIGDYVDAEIRRFQGA